MKNSIEAGLPAKTADRRISRTLLDCMKRLFSGYENFTAPYHFPIIFLSILSYTIWCPPILFGKTLYNLAKLSLFAKLYGVLPDCMGFCQIVSLLPNRMRFCQKVSLSPNCIRLSPNRLYFLAKEPQNKSSPTPECKIAPKNTQK